MINSSNTNINSIIIFLTNDNDRTINRHELRELNVENLFYKEN